MAPVNPTQTNANDAPGGALLVATAVGRQVAATPAAAANGGIHLKEEATLSKKNRQSAAAGAARTSKGTATEIAASDAKAEQTKEQRLAAAKARRAARREAYPVVTLTVKLHRAAQQRDLVDQMLAAANTWASGHSYVVTQPDAKERKTGTALALVVDTPESFAAKAKVKGDPDKTRETAKAIATALRSDAVKAKATEMGVAPKDLVLTALQSQFGIEIDL